MVSNKVLLVGPSTNMTYLHSLNRSFAITAACILMKLKDASNPPPLPSLLFNSREPNAQESFCHSEPSVVRLSIDVVPP